MRSLDQSSKFAGRHESHIASAFPSHDDDLLLIDNVVEHSREIFP
jgi:hypothetical protein